MCVDEAERKARRDAFDIVAAARERLLRDLDMSPDAWEQALLQLNGVARYCLAGWEDALQREELDRAYVSRHAGEQSERSPRHLRYTGST